MKQVIFRLLLCLAALSLLGGRALAAEGTPSLPEEVVRAAPEAASLVNGDGAESFGLLSGAAALLDEGMEALRTYRFSGIRAGWRWWGWGSCCWVRWRARRRPAGTH